MSEEFFTALPVDGGVQVDMSESVAESWVRILRMLEIMYRRRNSRLYTRRRPWGLSRRAVLRRLYPDMAESPRESKAFRRRHHAILTDAELVGQVLARWEGPRPFVLTFAEVDEWIAVMGQSSALYRQLPLSVQTETLAGHVQRQLVVAVDPEAFTGPAATDRSA